MAKNPKADAETQEEIPDVPAKKPAGKKTMILIAALCCVLGSGGTWFALRLFPAAPGEAKAEPVKKNPVKQVNRAGPPVYLPLEAFVVNLRNPQAQGNDQFLQTEMTLRLAGPGVVDAVKAHMPEVRNRILMLLANKTSQEVLTTDGKLKLAEAVRLEITAVVDPESIPAPAPLKITRVAAEGEAAEAKRPRTRPPKPKPATKKRAKRSRPRTIWSRACCSLPSSSSRSAPRAWPKNF